MTAPLNDGMWLTSSEGLFRLAARFDREGRARAALELYRRVLSAQPDHVAARIETGLLQLQLKRPSRALASFDRALCFDPGSASAHRHRATALRSLGRAREARAALAWAACAERSCASGNANETHAQSARA